MSTAPLSLVLLIIFTNLSACSKKTELTHFTNLSTYDKKAPGDLLNDPVIGSEFKKLVHAEQRVCLDDLFNYMPDLEIKQNGSLEAVMYGGGSANHIIAYLDLTPQGNLDLVMTCAEGSLSAKPYIYFTNRELKNPTLKLKDWLEAIQDDIASLTITNGKQSLQATAATFIDRSKSESALALSQQPVVVEQFDAESDAKVGEVQKAQADQVNTFADANSGSNQSTAESTVDRDLRQRCVVQAVTQGYPGGDCAYMFINECVTTQSREKMQKWLKMDGQAGYYTTSTCPNMPKIYVEEFMIEKRKQDRF